MIKHFLKGNYEFVRFPSTGQMRGAHKLRHRVANSCLNDRKFLTCDRFPLLRFSLTSFSYISASFKTNLIAWQNSPLRHVPFYSCNCVAVIESLAASAIQDDFIR